MGTTSTTVLIANPSPDVYGSDLQMLESVAAMRAEGWNVVVAMPNDGELVVRLQALGARVTFVNFPVLRRANQSLRALLRMVMDAVRCLPRLRRTIKALGASVVYVNTVTLPWWLLAARMARTPAICHLHEAETQDRRLIRRVLIVPLGLASAVIVISKATLDAMTDVAPGLRRKAHLIYNGVPTPPTTPTPPDHSGPWRVLFVGRLSPRKAPHVALEAVAELRRQGHEVEIELAGSAFAGYEWYAAELHERAAQPDLDQAVTFSGYCSPIWPALARSEIVVAPSLREPFGNAVVEAQLALRPVVATAALGHLESIVDGETGLLVPAEDVGATAKAVLRLIEDQEFARQLAAEARARALERFGTERYGREVTTLVRQLVTRSGRVAS